MEKLMTEKPELCIYTRSEMVEVLGQLYAANPSDVAALCDEALDKSGRLLGDVRNKARAIAGLSARR